MLNVYVFTNKKPIEADDLPEYLAQFADKFTDGLQTGKGFYTAFNSLEHFHRAFFHIASEQVALKNHIYVVADLDFDKYPQIEGYVEHRVFPELVEELNTLQTVFNVRMLSKFQLDSAVLYTFEGDGEVFNDAIKQTIRRSMKAI